MNCLITLMEAILLLSGAGSEEELDESLFERFERYSSHPLYLNTAGQRALMESGLLSEYQISVLLEQRQRAGTLRSYTELALLDGFGERTAEALQFFTTLEGEAQRSKELRGETLLRGSLRIRDGTIQGAGGTKMQIEIPERAALFWGSRISYADTKFSPGTFNAEYRGKNGRWNLLAGDFHARFGQGLCAWSGFSLSGFSSTGAFQRKAQGLTASHSFSEALRGLAASGDVGPVTLSGGLHATGLRERMEGKTDARIGLGYCLNATYRWRWGHAGLSAAGRGSAPTLAADWRMGAKGWAWLGELAWDFPGKDIAALTTLLWRPLYGIEATMNLRYYGPEFRNPDAGAPRAIGSANRDEAGGAIALSSPWGTVSYSIFTKPSSGGIGHKAILQAGHSWHSGPLEWSPSLRSLLSWRSWSGTPLRAEIRGDLGVHYEKAALNLRYHTVFCRERSWLWYAEAGYSGAWLRFTLFKVDQWDDRIYVYERDLSGAFSVPASYGRGWSLSLSTNQTIRSRHLRQRIGFKASYIHYFPSEVKRSSAFEGKVQYIIDWGWRFPSSSRGNL
jgi:hypothetical protein